MTEEVSKRARRPSGSGDDMHISQAHILRVLGRLKDRLHQVRDRLDRVDRLDSETELLDVRPLGRGIQLFRQLDSGRASNVRLRMAAVRLDPIVRRIIAATPVRMPLSGTSTLSSPLELRDSDLLRFHEISARAMLRDLHRHDQFKMTGFAFLDKCLELQTADLSSGQIALGDHDQLLELQEQVVEHSGRNYQHIISFLWVLLDGDVTRVRRVLRAQVLEQPRPTRAQSKTHYLAHLCHFSGVFADIAEFLVENGFDSEGILAACIELFVEIVGDERQFDPSRPITAVSYERNLFSFFREALSRPAGDGNAMVRKSLAGSGFSSGSLGLLITKGVSRAESSASLLLVSHFHFFAALREVWFLIRDFQKAGKTGRVAKMSVSESPGDDDPDQRAAALPSLRRRKTLVSKVNEVLLAPRLNDRLAEGQKLSRHALCWHAKDTELSGEQVLGEREEDTAVFRHGLRYLLHFCEQQLAAIHVPTLESIRVDGNTERGLDSDPFEHLVELLLRVISPEEIFRNSAARSVFTGLLKGIRKRGERVTPALRKSVQVLLSSGDPFLELPLSKQKSGSARGRAKSGSDIHQAKGASVREQAMTLAMALFGSRCLRPIVHEFRMDDDSDDAEMDPRKPLFPMVGAENLGDLDALRRNFDTAAIGIPRQDLLAAARALISTYATKKEACTPTVEWARAQAESFFETKGLYRFDFFASATIAFRHFAERCLKLRPGDHVVITTQEYDALIANCCHDPLLIGVRGVELTGSLFLTDKMIPVATLDVRSAPSATRVILGDSLRVVPFDQPIPLDISFPEELSALSVSVVGKKAEYVVLDQVAEGLTCLPKGSLLVGHVAVVPPQEPGTHSTEMNVEVRPVSIEIPDDIPLNAEVSGEVVPEQHPRRIFCFPDVVADSDKGADFVIVDSSLRVVLPDQRDRFSALSSQNLPKVSATAVSVGQRVMISACEDTPETLPTGTRLIGKTIVVSRKKQKTGSDVFSATSEPLRIETSDKPVRAVDINTEEDGRIRPRTVQELFEAYCEVIDPDHSRLILLSTKTRYGDAPCSSHGKAFRQPNGYYLIELVTLLRDEFPNIPIFLDDVQGLGRAVLIELLKLGVAGVLYSGNKSVGVGEVGMLALLESYLADLPSDQRYNREYDSSINIDQIAALGLALHQLGSRKDFLRLEGNKPLPRLAPFRHESIPLDELMSHLSAIIPDNQLPVFSDLVAELTEDAQEAFVCVDRDWLIRIVYHEDPSPVFDVSLSKQKKWTPRPGLQDSALVVPNLKRPRVQYERQAWHMAYLTRYVIELVRIYTDDFVERILPELDPESEFTGTSLALDAERFGCRVVRPVNRNYYDFFGVITLQIPYLRGWRIQRFLAQSGFKVVSALPGETAFRVSFHYLHNPEDVDRLFAFIRDAHRRGAERKILALKALKEAHQGCRAALDRFVTFLEEGDEHVRAASEVNCRTAELEGITNDNSLSPFEKAERIRGLTKMIDGAHSEEVGALFSAARLASEVDDGSDLDSGSISDSGLTEDQVEAAFAMSMHIEPAPGDADHVDPKTSEDESAFMPMPGGPDEPSG